MVTRSSTRRANINYAGLSGAGPSMPFFWIADEVALNFDHVAASIDFDGRPMELPVCQLDGFGAARLDL